jgi:hypothetical protein
MTTTAELSAGNVGSRDSVQDAGDDIRQGVAMTTASQREHDKFGPNGIT